MRPETAGAEAPSTGGNHHWSRNDLKDLLQEGLGDLPILVVSNREPWIHARQDGGEIQANRPASGLVAALEPFAEATAGTWIAHGSGDADRCSVDQSDPTRPARPRLGMCNRSFKGGGPGQTHTDPTVPSDPSSQQAHDPTAAGQQRHARDHKPTSVSDCRADQR